jgi:amidase
MTPTDPTLWSTTQQADAIRRKELSSRELLHLHLSRIEALDPMINAVCTLKAEAALEAACAADQRTARGESDGPLHGLTVTVKDAIATAGIRSTGGAVALRDHVPTTDAPVVERIKGAGAIVFGKTNLPEWSGDWQSFNEMFGTTNNPWDLTRTPGGSSGGAAAGVAAGMTSFEIGTDIGGSVRVPSAFCGVFGHKPSFGIISTLGYLDEPNGGAVESDVNVFGPIARSAGDLAVLLDCLAGPTADAGAAWRLELPPAGVKGLRGLRVGVWLEIDGLVQERAMVQQLEQFVAALGNAGARIDATARPAFDALTAASTGFQLIGSATAISDSNMKMPHTRWMQKDRERALFRRAWADYFEHVDVLLCPVASCTAFPHLQEGEFGDRLLPIDGVGVPYPLFGVWAALIGSVYLPSTSVPVGRTPSGLPVGVQVVSPYLHDQRSIAVAGLIAELAGGFSPPPIVDPSGSR